MISFNAVERAVVAPKPWPLQLALSVLFVAVAAAGRWLIERGAHGVSHEVVVDNAGGYLMQVGSGDVCIVGSDRTTATGDAPVPRASPGRRPDAALSCSSVGRGPVTP